ncbi:MerR family transcriptional regulator [Cohnella fermenti]|uniref:MerR family transcriptional regulator n=1 Tax=Cohnella fermenti TaxID=2565925 RepID=A0A4S4C7K3_9BACL|nr:MerR family transcriptional regulator [Cohnella fermenti]THF83871.1 MerR family transcriptional regulator [Cohnella fermenti]
MRQESSEPKRRLYRIGELSRLTGISPRTIDYYTGMGLLAPAQRSSGNYRLYDDETLERIRRIEMLKAQKFTLDEIKENFATLHRVSPSEQVTKQLAELQTHLTQIERQVKELEPVIDTLKPSQAKKLFHAITPQTAACVEALLLLLGKSNLM